MRLKTVRLYPFGRFLDNSWDISQALAIVAGPNETGKTTLRQAIFHTLFTPTNLPPAKLRDTMERWFPLPAGDHAAVSMTFEHDGREWTLAKRWGVGKSTQLSAAGIASLADPQAVAKKLAEMLGHSEATFKHVLCTGHTELEQTIASLQKNATQLRDIRDLLRAGGAGAGDVDEHRLRNALNERIKEAANNWDDVRGRPQRQNGQERGIENKWKQNVGEILRAWYAWQDLIAERNEIVRIETEIDRFTRELAQLDDQNRSDQKLIDDYGSLRSQLAERSMLEERIPRLEKDVGDLHEVFTKWPKADAKIDTWKMQKPELDEQAKRLDAERRTARRREGAAATIRVYDSIVEAQKVLAEAQAAMQQQLHPDEATLSEINRLDNMICSAESKLVARTLAWRVEVAEPQSISVTSGVGAVETIEVGHDGVKGTAAGRVHLEVRGIRLTVDGGDDDVDAILIDLQRSKGSLAALLASCGAETVAAARELARTYTKLVQREHSALTTFQALLQGKSFEQWKQEAEEVNALPQTRDVQSIDEEIRINENQLARGTQQVADYERQIAEWKSKYTHVDTIGETLYKTKSEIQKAVDQLAAASTLPPGFTSAQHLILELDAAQKRLNESRQPREDIKRNLTLREVELGDRRSEDITEKAEVAERAFQRVRTKGQALQRILETLDRMTAGGDDIIQGFAGRVEEIFSRLSRDAATLEFDGSLPTHVHRGVVKLEPTRLSQGAGGALALAIRLAMAEAYLNLTGGFIMLDDPLVHFDASRAEEAASIIRKFSERHQVIFFTCHEHQAAYLKA